MSRERPMLAVLFADLVRSTQLYDTLGNPTAQAIVNRCLDLLARVCVHYGGTVVKTIGDEIMCTFSRADDAVQAAQEMNKSLSALSFPELPGFQAPTSIPASSTER
jgi:class 3 adenylate cyclase